MPTFPYLIVNAFTRSSLGGNPAAVILLPPASLSPNSPTPTLDTETMLNVAKSLAQPILVFFSPPGPDNDADDNVFDIRFFTLNHSPPICGHGLLATTKAIYNGYFAGVSNKDEVVKFRTVTGTIISARAISPVDQEIDGEFYALELAAAKLRELRGEDRDRVHDAVAKALGKDPAHLGINHIAGGEGELGRHLMVVLDGKDDLVNRDIDTSALLGAQPFGVISLSYATPDKEYAFISRGFAPAFGIPEDHVCGSSHALMVPYYASLPQNRLKAGKETYVRQVSPRGGDLWVTLDEQRGVVILKGNAKLFAKGELTI